MPLRFSLLVNSTNSTNLEVQNLLSNVRTFPDLGMHCLHVRILLATCQYFLTSGRLWRRSQRRTTASASPATDVNRQRCNV